MGKRLLLVGCSERKASCPGALPAIARYDGPVFQVLRRFLREFRWPADLSVAVLSAEHGLIGGMAPVEYYDRRMDARRAEELKQSVSETLKKWGAFHERLDVVLGKEYQKAVADAICGRQGIVVRAGPIGQQLAHVRRALRECRMEPRRPAALPEKERPLYFLPDWDDFVDAEFDFLADRFSGPRGERREIHAVNLMRPERLCDGVLVSLAQHIGSKGLFRRREPNSLETLAPEAAHKRFHLASDQLAFADCGAFTYVSEPEPPVTVEQAVALYELYEFDLGCSVDHIPVAEIDTPGGRRPLSVRERRRRMRLTRDNADGFLRAHSQARAKFLPVGVIQGISPDDYADQVRDYIDMGYEAIALGGLVPRSDREIAEVVQLVARRLKTLGRKPWIHLLGVYRPRLQALFKEARIDSFDSATYFRKAWLRANQNYLGADGEWYAAIRVPPSHDPRTARRLRRCGRPEGEIKRLEQEALKALRAYDQGEISVERCLAAVLAYDRLLSRGEASRRLAEAYRRTLEKRPWNHCSCAMCSALSINIVIFRGLNRNKRRGAHNTLMLYQSLHIAHASGRGRP